VDVLEVPAEKHRSDIAKVLKAWFPSLDLFGTERSLKHESTRLISGVDEDSARRIIDALKALKVVAHAAEPRSWASRFLNPGLVVTVLALLAAPWVSLLPALLLVVVAVGAPVALGLLKRDTQTPLVSGPHFGASAEDWARIGQDYARVVARLAPENARALQSIARGVFDLRSGLSGESLAAAAAGGTSGELSGRLLDVLRSAVAIGGRTLSGDAPDREAAGKELDSVNALMDETRAWFTTLEREGVKEAPEVTDELTGIRSRIDAIVHEVRSVTPTPSRERELG
jgi:hypothetical protein